MRRFEEEFDLADLLYHEEDIITNDGKSNFENLSQEQLKKICCQLFIRPVVLKSCIEKYIQKTLNNMQEQI